MQVRGFLSHNFENVQDNLGLCFTSFPETLRCLFPHPMVYHLVPNLETVGVGVTPVHATWSLLKGME